ncbi:unnamed protein product [Brassica oleracea]
MDPRLQQAAESGSINALYALIDEDPYILENIDAVPFINTPLHAVRLLLECRLVERNKVNGDGLTFLDILRNLENAGVWDLDLKQVVLKTGCKEAASVPKPKAVSQPFKSRFTRGTHRSTFANRLRSNTSEEVRGALLIVFTLIITATYQTALQPPGGGQQSKDPHSSTNDLQIKHAFLLFLWVFNTIGFYCALFNISCLLPRKPHLNAWFMSVETYLGVCYALAVAENSPDPVFFCTMTCAILLLYFIYIGWLGLVGRQIYRTAIKLLLECQLVKPNEVNGDGLTFLDILRHQGQSRDLELEQAVFKTRCKEATSLPKLGKTTSDQFKTPITFWSYCSTGIKRLKSDTSEEGRAVFLIICTLIITSTYQTALQPPGGLRQSEDGGSAAVMKQTFFIVLWVSNTIGFCCALLYTFCLLPVSSLFTTWFFWIGASLGVSYALAMAVISPHPVLFICAAFALYLLFPLYLFMEIFIALRLSHLKATVSRMFVTLLKQRQSKA